MDPYATHLKYTVSAAVQSGILWPHSPILELGCGHYSTPLLASIAKAQNREFHVLTSDPSWANLFQKETPFLHMIDFDAWQNISFETEWGMVLIDHEELLFYRYNQLLKLSERAKVVVFHDSNRIDDLQISWLPMTYLYKNSFFAKDYTPNTAIFSNFTDPAQWFND